MSLASKVLLGLGLGILTGLFFGESVAFLSLPGRAFVVLLQMTVLPFVSVAMIHSLGSLQPADARRLARFAGSFLLVIWGVTLAVVAAVPLAFPDWEAASFFSTSLVEQGPPFDPVALYLPANPFHSFAEGVVPAIVVFSVAVGLALMAVPRRQALLESLGALEDALQRVAGFVVSLAPYGVFAIAGEAAGTMRGDELLGLQVYSAAYVVCAVALTFWVLPVLVTSLTPFRYGEALGRARAALITAFATGSVFVVLPLLSQCCKDLLETRDRARGSEQTVDVIVPIAFALSSAGKLLSLAFVLFAGWLSGFPVAVSQIPSFLATGLFSFFASTVVAVPFLLDLFNVPADTFRLFLIADNVVGNRFGSMLASVHILSLTLLGACGTAGLLAVRTRKLLRWGAVTLALIGFGLGGVRLAFDAVERPYEGYKQFVDRTPLLPSVPTRELSAPPAGRSGATLARIRDAGSLRVGWWRNRLPFAFRNEAGELVGFDIDMAHALARDMNARLELVPIERGQTADLLDQGIVDVVMTGIAITPARLEHLDLTDPYIEETLAFVVPDHRREEFSSRAAVRAHASLRLAVPATSYYVDLVHAYLPRAELVTVDSPREFFRAAPGTFDGLVFTAESGSAWTLIYPQFSVAVPQPDVVEVPLGYAVRRGDARMVAFLDAWIGLKQRDRTIERLRDYWILGIDPPGAQQPRWSILRDVLGVGAPASGEAEPSTRADRSAS